MEVYVKNIVISFNSSNTNCTITYDAFNGAFGVANSTLNIIPPKNQQEINTALRNDVVALALAAWATTVSPDNIIFEGAGDQVIPKVVSYPSRSFNTVYQPNADKDTLVVVNASVGTSLSLTTGAAGSAIFEVSDNAGFTVGVHEIGRVQSSLTGTLIVGLGLNAVSGNAITGTVSAGKYYRIRTATTTGTPNYTLLGVQETA